MVEMRQSATQRIQVGLVGLVVVLLFVSLANMALDRANEKPADAVNQAEDPATMNTQPQSQPAGEPLAELGVTPVAKEETTLPGAPDAGTTNVKAAPAKME